MTNTIKKTLTYVKPKAPVEKVDDISSDCRRQPVGDSLNEVQAETLSDVEAKPVVKTLKDTIAKN